MGLFDIENEQKKTEDIIMAVISLETIRLRFNFPSFYSIWRDIFPSLTFFIFLKFRVMGAGRRYVTPLKTVY
jgi:hypothetical protein